MNRSTLLLALCVSLPACLPGASLAQAIAEGGDAGDIADSQEALGEGDALPDGKDAVSEYKDALAKAESALG